MAASSDSGAGGAAPAPAAGGLFGFRRVSRSAADADPAGPRRSSNPAADQRETEKRLAKLLRKAKPFFDEKLKPKARLLALFTFVDAAQAAHDYDLLKRFVLEHDAAVYAVMSDAFWHQVDKIRALVHKTPDRPPHVGTSSSAKATDKDSKEVADLFKILNVLRTVLLYSPDKIRKGWQRGSLSTIFRTLLHSGNHIRLRTEGLRLLLLWLNDQDHDAILFALLPRATPSPGGAAESEAVREMVRLYRDAISLGVFLPCWELPEPRTAAVADGAGGVYDEKGLGTVEQMRIGANEPLGPLIPAPTPPPASRVTQQRQDSIDLLEEVLFNIALLARAAADGTPPPPAPGPATTRADEPLGALSPPPSMPPSGPTSPNLLPADFTEIEDRIPPSHASALRTLRSMWDLFARTYLRLLFPGAARRIGLAVAEGEGFALCPPEAIETLLVFLLRAMSATVPTSRPADALVASAGPDSLPSGSFRVDHGIPAAAGALLRRIMLGETLEVFHEAVRQSMMVPWRYHEAVALGLGTLKSWIFVEPHERPPHLRSSRRTSGPPDAKLSHHLPRYIYFARLLFLDRADPGDTEARLQKYRDGLVFFRVLVMETFADLNPEAWQTLLQCLLDVHRQLVLSRPDMYALFGGPKAGDELVGMVVETMLVAWVRSKIQAASVWKALFAQLSHPNSTRYSRTITEWARIMGKLTKALALLKLGVDLDAPENEAGLPKRRAYGSGNQRLDGTPSPEADGRLSRPRGTSGDPSSEKSSRAPSGSSATGQPSRLQEFTSPQALDLSGENALFAWKNVLVILGNPNGIQSPAIQAEAVRSAVGIYDMLAWIRACQPYRGVPLPPLYDFVTWIFQACGLSAEYVEGRAAAYGCMCRMMCRRHDQRLGNEYFAHFYRLVIKGLAGTDVNVIFAIINNSTRLFGLNLPGSTILIPAFLKCFRQLFFGVPKGSPFASFDGLQRSTDASQLVPESVRQNIAIMLSAIASTCNTVPDGTCIVLDFADGALAAAPHPSDPTAGESLVGLIEQVGRERRPPELSMVEAKTLAKSLLLALLRDDLDSQKLDERVASHRYLLNAICDMAYEELVLVSKLDRAVVDEGFSAILGHLLQRNLHAINAAVDCLNLFSQSFANLDRLDQNAAFGIIEKIVGAIQEHFAWVPAGRNQELVRACAIARLFYCLLDWLLCIPPEWFQNARFLHLVFDTIETGLNEGMPLVGPGSKRGRGPPESRPSRRPPARVNEESSTDISKSGSMASIEEGQEPGDQEPTLIRDAAENVLMHVLHHVNNFPPTNGPAMMNTSILDPELADDTDRSKTLYFSYNEKTLLTFVEMQGRTPLDSKVRVIVRDIAGKYCWDSWLFYDSLDKMREVLVGGDPALEGKLPPLLGVLDRMVFADDVTIESRTRKVTPDRSFDGELWSSENAARDPDRLKELLIAIGQRSPDCLRIPGHSLVEPEPVPEDQVAVVSEAAQRMKFQVEQERPILEKHAYPRKDDGGADSGDELSTAYFVPARPPEAEATIPPYHRTRLLLSHLGFVNFDSLRENNFYMLTKSPALFRDIKGLDKTVGRETIKVAVIYVGPGQEDEASILRNQRTSADYVEFVSSLGWEVDLASHAGYLGGLERNLTSGARATYFCNSTLEIIYHEVTKLPTDPNDPKQVKKKRHIGNDQVHVIWNEHPRDYRRNTISGDYANAQIVITPLANGFYAVDISRDPKVSPFGPLEPHSIVSKASLGALVRATCVAAHRYSLLSLTDKLDLYRHSYTQRVANLRMIKERHQTKTWTFEHFLRFLATGADS